MTTRGELEGGHRMSPSFDQTKIDEFWTFVNKNFFTLEPSPDLPVCYGEIIGRLHQKYPKKVGLKVENWLVGIGVQVNDVLLVAEAWSHNLIFLTNDNIEKIKEVLEPGEVRFDNWISI
jgi:hypothetical protein